MEKEYDTIEFFNRLTFVNTVRKDDAEIAKRAIQIFNGKLERQEKMIEGEMSKRQNVSNGMITMQPDSLGVTDASVKNFIVNAIYQSLVAASMPSGADGKTRRRVRRKVWADLAKGTFNTEEFTNAVVDAKYSLKQAAKIL